MKLIKFYFFILVSLSIKLNSITYTASGCPGPLNWSGFNATCPFFNGGTRLTTQPAAGSILVIPVGCTVTVTGVPTQINNAITLQIDGVLRFAQSPSPPSILKFSGASTVVIGSTGTISSAGTSGASEITFSSGDKWQATNGNLNGPATISNACAYVGPPTLWSPAGCGVTLPIELINFTGTCISNGVQLSWITATEKNNDYFLIEKSSNGNDWQYVSKIKGHGTSETTNNYLHFDKSNNYELTYYRLSQVDFGGQTTIFKFIDIDCKQNSINQIVLYPNPTSSDLNVFINVKYDSSNNKLKVLDNLGQVVVEKTIDLIKGINNFILPMNISAGTYSVVLASDNISIPSQKLIIMK